MEQEEKRTAISISLSKSEKCLFMEKTRSYNDYRFMRVMPKRFSIIEI